MFGLLFTFVLLACLAIYFLVKRHAITIKEEKGFLHSLPKYYGLYASLWFSIPTICIVALYLLFAESFVTSNLINSLPDEIKSLSDNELTLVLNDIKNLAVGNISSSSSFAEIQLAANYYNSQYDIVNNMVFYSSLILGLLTFIYAYRSITATYRARNFIENAIHFLLFSSAVIAIFVTAGILLSVLFEALRFFEVINFSEFLQGELKTSYEKHKDL